MAASRFQRATALVPLALLSTAVTATLAGVGPTSAVADEDPSTSLPDGSSVPTEAIEAPASLSRPGVVAPGTGKHLDDDAVASASASGIPDAALTAYQRAETVINAADKTCNITWQLIAAIGRVESDHGRVNGNSLDDHGLARPGIYGIPLDGTHNTTAIRDTDAGQYDADARWDRAVGPLQFIPSTWSVVGVDGDNDGKRNPQDIDDAALATAVYLCSGNDDLSTDPGRRAAVYRYNHSHDYVDLVLSFMDAYLDGDFTAVPNGTTHVGTALPTPRPGQLARAKALRAEIGQSGRGRGDGHAAGGGHGGDDLGYQLGPDPVELELPTDAPTQEPTDPDTSTPSPSDPGTGSGTPSPTDPDTGSSTPSPTDPGTGTSTPTEEPIRTEEEASEACVLELEAPSDDPVELEALGLLDDYNACMEELGYPQ